MIRLKDNSDCQQRIQRGGWAEDILRQRCSFPIGPLNFWSNLAYIFAGFGALALDPSATGIVMCVALVVLGIGSGLYHGFKTLFTNQLDWVGMTAVAGSLGMYAAISHAHLTWLAMAITGAGMAGYFVYAEPKLGGDTLIGLLLWLTIWPMALTGSTPLALASLAAFGLAYGAQRAGHSISSNPDTRWELRPWYQRLVGISGHAVWHVLTALAILLMFWAGVGR